MHSRWRSLGTLLFVSFATLVSARQPPVAWPQFRGSQASGVADGQALP